MPTSLPPHPALSVANGSATEAEVLSLSLAEQLRVAITRGEVAPGAKLRMEELREAFGVSLSPLREALSRLVAEGFVVAESQRGFRVAPVSSANLREVTRLRLALEPMALHASITQGDAAWEGRVVAATYQLKKHALPVGESTDSDDFERWEGVHRSFHLTLLDACGMPLLQQFCMTLHDFADRYRRLFLSRHPKDRLVPGEHERLAELALARQADEASALLTTHIRRISELVLQTVESVEAQAAGGPARRRGRPRVNGS